MTVSPPSLTRSTHAPAREHYRRVDSRGRRSAPATRVGSRVGQSVGHRRNIDHHLRHLTGQGGGQARGRTADLPIRSRTRRSPLDTARRCPPAAGLSNGIAYQYRTFASKYRRNVGVKWGVDLGWALRNSFVPKQHGHRITPPFCKETCTGCPARSVLITCAVLITALY